MSSSDTAYVVDDPPPPKEPPDKKKVSRPDVSLRKLNQKQLISTCVACHLPGRLAPTLDPHIRYMLGQEIDLFVSTVSKVTHRLSIMMNRIILHLIDTNTPIPKMNSSFFTGLALSGLKKRNKNSKEEYSSLINEFYNNNFDTKKGMFPHIERQNGDGQAITLACNRYATNFKNAMVFPFLTRQKKYIQTWMKENNIDCLYPYDVQKKINRWDGWNKKERKDKKKRCDNLPIELETFIRNEQNMLTENVSEKWLKNNTDKVISYYHHILTYYHTIDAKKFRIAPLSQIKSHFITIDNTVLREILNNVRSKVENKSGCVFPYYINEAIDNKEMTIDVWKTIFDYDGLRRRRQFGFQVDTDGEKMCFHFTMNQKKHIKSRRKSKNKKKKKQKHRGRIISIDPGRCNLITAYDEEKNTFSRLTRKHYYRASWMEERTKRATRRNLRMKDVYEELSKTSTKTAQDKDWIEYQNVVASNYDKLWGFKLEKVWKKEAFRVYCLKQRCLDRYFNSFQLKGEAAPKILYGAASFNHTGKGELSVPVKYVYEKCCQRYYTVKEDERYSTKMHHKCKGTMCPVKKEGREIRGLRWCPTCRELVSRDPNACININVSGKAEKRPEYLCETYSRPEKNEIRAYTLGCQWYKEFLMERVQHNKKKTDERICKERISHSKEW